MKELLEKPYKIKKKIGYLEKELERYRVMMNSIPHTVYGQERIDKSPSNKTINQIGLEKYEETKEKISEKEKEYIEAVNKAEEAIETLESDEIKLMLKYRYLEFMTFDEIADKLYVCKRTIYRWIKAIEK